MVWWGMRMPFKLGPLSLTLGLDGRIFYHVQQDPLNGIPFSTLLNDVLNDSFSASSITLWGGYGLLADAGLKAGIGPVMLGFAVRVV